MTNVVLNVYDQNYNVIKSSRSFWN